MNCVVKRQEVILFEHDGNWLHPLFALEDFLAGENLKADDLSLEDKLIGRGAAILIARMGIKRCHGRVVSRKALPVAEKYNITLTWDSLVDTLSCQTEQVLTEDMSLEESYRELARRAGRTGL